MRDTVLDKKDNLKVRTEAPDKMKTMLSESDLKKVKQCNSVNRSMVIGMKSNRSRKNLPKRLKKLISQSTQNRKKIKSNINSKGVSSKKTIKFKPDYNAYMVIKKGNFNVRIVSPDEVKYMMSESDIEMDKRVEQAVKAAIERAEICGKPIARYDPVKKKAYMEYPDGTKKYSE